LHCFFIDNCGVAFFVLALNEVVCFGKISQVDVLGVEFFREFFGGGCFAYAWCACDEDNSFHETILVGGLIIGFA
jgi:hypothetical protein